MNFKRLKKIKNFFFPPNKIIQPSSFNIKRVKLVTFLFILCFFLLSIRGIVIHLFSPSADSLNKIANHQYNQQIYLSKYRGTIFDRRGAPFALSIKTPSIFINPREFSPTDDEVNKIHGILNISKDTILKLSKKNNYFSWLKRNATFEEGKKLQDIKIEGLYQITEPARFYPEGSSAANLIGIVGVDDNGLFGIEKEYDTTLKGEHTKVFQTRDARGKIFYMESQKASPTTASKDIYLTIDKVIQQIAEDALIQGVKEANAIGGFAIVSDPHTGKILALANYPSFNPNNKKTLKIQNTKNKALTDLFEPGSVIKPIIAASAIEQGLTSRYDKHDCEEGKFKIGKNTFRDSHKPATRFLTTEETIITSSNVCAYKIGLKLGEEKVFDSLKNFGIGEKINNISFPALSTGRLIPWQSWKPIRFANITFGQGFLTTGLELVRAFSAIANGGKLVNPYYMDKIGIAKDFKIVNQKQEEKYVISPKTSEIMKEILAEVVEKGVTAAKMDEYSSGGKTGTTQKVDETTHAYSKTKHLSSFMGIAPIKDPFIVVYVQIDEPHQKVSYGAKWAAPVFKNIAENTLKYLNVKPDKKIEMNNNKENKFISKKIDNTTSTL